MPLRSGALARQREGAHSVPESQVRGGELNGYDAGAKKHKLIRVIDESGEDYLYPESYFLPVTLPPATRQAVLAAA